MAWKIVRFFFEKRAFESQLASILRAAAGHEANSMPVGHYEYKILCNEADSLCARFSERWQLDLDLLRARIPGLYKLGDLSTPKTPLNLSRIIGLGLIAVPLLFFLLGAFAGFFSLGFHAIGGQ